VPDPETLAEDPAAACSQQTQYFSDSTKSIIAHNQSADLGFDASINPYRGCAHGCAYCYSRPYHEFLGFSAGLDFETKIMVKERAPELLRKELASARWRPQVIAMCGVTDAYQPIERHLKLTRACLEVLAEFHNPVTIVTKNRMVARDSDILSHLACVEAASVCLSITTLDPDLARRLEPRASSPMARLEAVRTLAASSIPVGVMVAPVIPGLTDHEVPSILRASREAGASYAFYTVVRLPAPVDTLFDAWLVQHAPGSRAKVLNRVRDFYHGTLDCTETGTRFRGAGVWAEQLSSLFDASCRRLGLARSAPSLSTAAFRQPGPRQLHFLE
jgi:DNA repair photolyase